MTNRLLQLLRGRRIAIVGNSPVSYNYSTEIDTADVVVRFNDFYNIHSGKVGKRVNIVLQTVAKAWFERYSAGLLTKSLEMVRTQHPDIFLVKRPDNYNTDAHAVYGKGIRIDNLARCFEPWWKYTTGTAALCWLAENLTGENAPASIKCYAFSNEGDETPWDNYITGDAAHYSHVAQEERKAQKEAIAKLESMSIIDPPPPILSIPKCVVVPVKATSSGAPGKNRLLLRSCLEKLQELDMPVYVTGDDLELLHEVKDLCEPVPVPAIPAFRDVTDTMRRWQVETGFCGDVAHVQCTSPGLKPEWVLRCFDALSCAPVAATCIELGFKPTAIFREENGVFVPCSQALPPATVARQLLPKAVRFTGAVVAFHTDALACDSFFQAGVMEPVMVDEEDSLDVDTPEQLKEALDHK